MADTFLTTAFGLTGAAWPIDELLSKDVADAAGATIEGARRSVDSPATKTDDLISHTKRLIGMRTGFLMGGGDINIETVPTQIYLGGAEIQGGGNIDLDGGHLDVMRHLEVDPNVNFTRLSGIYSYLRSVIEEKTGKKLSNTFDDQVRNTLNELKAKEHEVRDQLVAMNTFQHLGKDASDDTNEWDSNNMTLGAAQDALKKYLDSDKVLRSHAMGSVDMLLRLAASAMRLR